MRQSQSQNRQRSRGRNNNRNNNNNNRNQLNRSMESNGPDVRIRGTAAHIAEKYTQLATDAQTSGDTVAAQSYWQFAEHYNRVIAAAQAAQQQAREEQEAKREARKEADSENENAKDARGSDKRRERRPRRETNSSNAEKANGSAVEDDEQSSVKGEGPQPALDSTPAEVALAEKPVIEEEKPAKTRRTRRAPKKKDPADAAPVAESVDSLPAFVTGE